MTLTVLLRRSLIDQSDVEKILASTGTVMAEARLHPSTIEAIMHVMRSALDPPEPVDEKRQ